MCDDLQICSFVRGLESNFNLVLTEFCMVSSSFKYCVTQLGSGINAASLRFCLRGSFHWLQCKLGYCLLYYSGPPRFEGERRFGDREGYRGGPRGSGGDFGDKGGAPADYQPSFRVISLFLLKKHLIVFSFLNGSYMLIYICHFIYVQW